ncbi:MAG: nucleotidyltransferase domain-containing protein [Hydrogenothermaceae bacterium]
MNKFGLKEEVLKKIIDVISANKKVKKIVLFGSRAKGNFQKESDIDLVIIAPDLTFSEYLKILTNLEELDIPYKIDLLHCNYLGRDIKEHISRVGVEIYSHNH